jgi:hypothetical protein
MNNKIDLTVPQIVSGDVKVLVRNTDKDGWVERYLVAIYKDNNNKILYKVWPAGNIGRSYGYDFYHIITYRYCKYIPKKRTRLMTRQECLGFIMHLKEPILVCYKNPLDSESYLDYPTRYYPPTYFGYVKNQIENLYYRYIDKKGNFISEPMKFEIEEEV